MVKEEEITLESGKHYLSNKDDEKKIFFRNLILPILGLFLFFLRCISMLELWNEEPFLFFTGFFQIEKGLKKEHIFFISNLIALGVALALIRNLKSSFLNAIVIVFLPIITPICVYDFLTIFFLNQRISIFFLSAHMPTTIAGIYIILKYKKTLSLKNYIFALSFVLIWVLILDLKRSLSFILWAGGIVIYILIAYTLILIILLIKNKNYKLKKPKIKFIK